VLHAGSYAFVELEGRRWTFGETSSAAEPARFFSLQESSSEVKAPIGKDQGAPPVRPGSSERPKATPTMPPSTQGVPR
jgi:hypothetical protein